MEYSGIPGVDALKHMEAKVDLRNSTLVMERTSLNYQGRRQSVVHYFNTNRRPEDITPEAKERNEPAGTPIPGLIPGGPRWFKLEHSDRRSRGLVIGKLVKKGTVEVPRKILIEPIGLVNHVMVLW